MTSEVPGHLRTNNTAYREAWTPYIREIARLSKHNQVTEGGPIIAVQVDNEYAQKSEVGFPGKAEMMREIEDELRAGGIMVPLTYNDATPQGAFVKGVGAADIYGLDSYPQVSELGYILHHCLTLLNVFSSVSTVQIQRFGTRLLKTIMTTT